MGAAGALRGALRKAMQRAYQLDYLPSQHEVVTIAEKWRPYRSLATSYLFSAAFDEPSPSSGARHPTLGLSS